ncbi:hypothetical protein GSI_10493 [Ganoderma sinense ZZ0214-1]|uniref:Snurportin-1 n=1 Tax=Ganoderma sinense ZZ0214-1 TaxID=1077348 RepID=A0A2G8S0P7_9APHY|nr:hypothetical protein GSI_10493 [Ganoderma sinense ZZ0214-1]
MFSDRKASFKTPPQAVKETLTSQEARRNRALEEQKRRRAERIDSTRQLDILADLSLGHSDDEADEDDDPNPQPDIVHEGVGHFVTMLPPAITAPTPVSSESAQPLAPEINMQTTQEKKRPKNKRKGKGRASQQQQHDPSAGVPHGSGAGTRPRGAGKPKAKNAKPSKWADKCMYAELLEMKEGGFDASADLRDGIPEDIETGWVAVTPVPSGKRCIAVTHQTSGIAGVVPNTTLRSRVLGKALMKPFPSSLPPQTVLDCILDDNWRDNGILHVLDVITWKGQDLGDCETPFRFWWRDTRLSELPTFPPPPNAAAADSTSPTSYVFPHPTSFSPIPYHTDTSLRSLLSSLIPLTRAPRSVSVTVPLLTSTSDGSAMDMDGPGGSPLVQLQRIHAPIAADGLLLYVAQAAYEPGTSPLSVWIPLVAYQTREEAQVQPGVNIAESPLDVFERLVRRRLALGSAHQGTPEIEMAP